MTDALATRRRVLHVTGVGLAGGLAGCAGGDGGDDDGGDEADAAETVIVGPENSLRFDPETVEIEQGETVRWEWESGPHNVLPAETPAEADWEGEPETSGGGHSYSHTFDVTGTYDYYCEPHRSSGMAGTVVVEGE